MARNSTEYLRFSAYSLKELITQKLASETKFTDQIYEGSNLAILIDIVCYMYQCMLYSLNKSAAEAMWSDTQIYENINRLAKLVGYCPKGASPATAVFTFTFDDERKGYDTVIPKYACIDTKLTDDNGKKIFYSLVDDCDVSDKTDNKILFYNGNWKLYPTVFTATGEQYQALLLESLTSNDEKQTYIPSNFIDIYIQEENSDLYVKWTRVEQGLFTDNNVQNGSKIYSQNDNIYNVRLNENKYYEITFGNGFTGNIPKKNSKIYIFYLNSNGPYGTISMGDVQDAKIKHDAAILGISQKMYEQLFGVTSGYTEDDEELNNLDIIKSEAKWQNVSSSTVGTVEESVDEIRRNAPQWFKTGNRLVTKSDWEYYIKNRFRDNIADVVCQNNWEYISSFYRWLYNLGVSKHDNAQYYLSKNRIIKYDYKWADAVDVNNVYLWIKMKNDADVYKTVIDNDVQNLKVITQEAVYLTPLNVQFAFCAQDVDEVRYNLKNNDVSFTNNYLEITVDDNTLYANSDILQRVKNIIINFFDEDNFTLGATVDNNKLTNEIFNIGTISRIRTVYRNETTGIERIFPGISFASWTSDFIDIGDDAEVTTVTKSLESFQFPKWYSQNFDNNIKIIRKSVGQLNTVQF